MILDFLTIENFGVYGGTQPPLELTPPDAEHPIILFGGWNGGGKTTLLDAIQLVLFGPKARLSNRPRSYKEALRQSIHRGADPEQGASLELQFRRVVDGTTHTYSVRRKWWVGEKDVEERLDVHVDGEPDPLLAEHWDEFIESYIPSGISHLFFFDAEQITELAEGQKAAELLGTAIHSLLGLELVDRLDSDLTVLERRKRAEGHTAEEIQELRQHEAEVQRLEGLLESAIQETARLRTEAERKAHELERAQDRFRKEGGDVYLRRSELEQRQSAVRAELEERKEVLRELIAGPAPLLLITPILHNAEKEIRAAGEQRRDLILLQALEDRDAAILQALTKCKLSAKAMATVETIFSEDRASRRQGLASAKSPEADEHLALEIRHLLQTTLPEAKSSIASAIKDVQRLNEQLVRVEHEIARIPAADAIAAHEAEVTRARGEHEAKSAELSAQEVTMASLQRELERARTQLDRVAAQHTDSLIQDESRLRVLKHSAKARDTLRSFRREIIRRHAAKIEHLMLESFNQLLRKTSLISGLRIDPDSFMIELTGGDGQPLPFNRLSAGERQLLATSLLWGLAKASGRPLPTIIDTPLGRLDSSHRRHLIERYFPVASHQVILLSTDEEITETNLRAIQPFLGRCYQLHHDDSLRSTTIQPGYFWNYETTC
jgi:DNA sulfur modification protein DndD